MSNTRELGQRGEALAEEFLKEKGYAILERSYRCPLGEIDLIARQGGALVFVEVKSRRSRDFGGPESAVHARKQSKIVKSALCYIKSKHLQGKPVRFDVVTVCNGQPHLIPNAFSSDRYTL